jgi:copper-(or silver)-translocating P-type ATPase/heavy metal-(Cd/Co/Hg/Pb/Zn)-translocating P-type ATPase
MSMLKFKCPHGAGCLQCGEILPIRIAELPGVVRVTPDSLLGEINVEGVISSDAVLEISKSVGIELVEVDIDECRIYSVAGISCLDCAAGFEKAVNQLPNVEKVTLNTLLGELTVEGTADLVTIQKLGEPEGYRVEAFGGKGEQIFVVAGISCLDCAAGFEKAVNQLRNVEKATLNTLTGELSVRGVVSLEELQDLGSPEGYRITQGKAKSLTLGAEHSHRGELWRAAGAAVLWGVAFALDWQDLKIASIAVYAVAIVIGGWSNFFKAFKAIRHRVFNMAVLMSVAVTGAALMGEWQEGAAVASLFALAEYLEEWSVERGRKALSTLVSLTPVTAHRLLAGEEFEVPAESLVPGDRIRIRPGEQVPSDGVIVAGISAVMQAAITGEPLPIDKAVGDRVFAGTINTHGALEVEVERAAGDTTLSRIIRLVAQAQSERAPVQQLVERFAAKYTPLVLVIAALIAIVPPVFFDSPWNESLYQALALLVVSCPCALVISTPVAIISAVTTGARNGVLIKAGAFLEAAAGLNILAFDKTGTITKGEPEIIQVVSLDGSSEDELLSKLSSLEKMSEHPLSKAILKEAAKRKLSFDEAQNVTAVPGRGLEGLLNGRKLQAGNDDWLEELNIDKPAGIEVPPEATPIWLAEEGKLLGLVEVADPLKPEIPGIMKELEELYIETVLLTGDRQETADALAAEAGIWRVRAHLLPDEKLAMIEGLQKEVPSVGMVGDGINDSPALAASNLGIAVGSGTDTAIETADVVMMDGSLQKLPFLIRLSRETLKVIKQNITIAVGLKVLAIGAAFFGALTLWLAILSDVGATFLVTLNSLRMLRKNS